MPYSPGWSVSTLTMTHEPSERVRMHLTDVILGTGDSLFCLRPPHRFATNEEGADVVLAGIFDRELAGLNHEVERVHPGSQGRSHDRVPSHRFVDRHQNFERRSPF